MSSARARARGKWNGRERSRADWARTPAPRSGRLAVKQFGFIAQLPRRNHMWKALGELIDGSDQATGRLRIETTTTAEGSQRRLRLLRREDIAETIAGLPI